VSFAKRPQPGREFRNGKNLLRHVGGFQITQAMRQAQIADHKGELVAINLQKNPASVKTRGS